MSASARPAQFGRIHPPDDAWLAKQGREPILDPELPIIDTRGWAALWNAFTRIAGGASQHERAALFSGTARRVYRLA